MDWKIGRISDANDVDPVAVGVQEAPPDDPVDPLPDEPVDPLPDEPVDPLPDDPELPELEPDFPGSVPDEEQAAAPATTPITRRARKDFVRAMASAPSFRTGSYAQREGFRE